MIAPGPYLAFCGPTLRLSYDEDACTAESGIVPECIPNAARHPAWSENREKYTNWLFELNNKIFYVQKMAQEKISFHLLRWSFSSESACNINGKCTVLYWGESLENVVLFPTIDDFFLNWEFSLKFPLIFSLLFPNVVITLSMLSAENNILNTNYCMSSILYRYILLKTDRIQCEKSLQTKPFSYWYLKNNNLLTSEIIVQIHHKLHGKPCNLDISTGIGRERDSS